MAAGAPNRVLMGATITVPEGSDVNMPFLSSMIANIMTSVQDTVAGGGGVAVDDSDAGRGIRRVTWTPDAARAAGRSRHRVSSRSRRDRSDRAAQAVAAGQPGDAAPTQPVDRQATLRARTALRLQNIQQTIENQGGLLTHACEAGHTKLTEWLCVYQQSSTFKEWITDKWMRT